jgi:hypothetical protein
MNTNTTLKLQNHLPALRPFFNLRTGYFRSIELMAIGVVLVTIAIVGYLFFNLLGERRQAVDSLHAESLQLRQEIDQINKQIKNKDFQVSNTKTALDNLDEFNNRFLKDPIKGRLILIDEINRLIKKNDMLLQSGISFDTIDDADTLALKQKQGGGRVKRGKDEKLNVYPGMRLDFAVFGPYDNFRRFLHDLETNNLFLIIERIDLQMQENDKQGSRNIAANTNQTASGIAIELGVKVYFRKQQVNATDQHSVQ